MDIESLKNQYNLVAGIAEQNTLTTQGVNYALEQVGLLHSNSIPGKVTCRIIKLIFSPIAIVEQTVRAALCPIAALFLLIRNDRLNEILFNNFFSHGITVLVPIVVVPLLPILVVAATVSCCFCCC